MYFIANLQPKLYDVDRYSGFLNYNEKKKIINDFEKSKLKGNDLPICFEHGGGIKAGFKLPDDQIIGKVNEMIINKSGDLMINGQINKESKIYDQMRNDMFNKIKLYGVSIWIDLKRNSDNIFTDKQLNHVAITTDPALGKEGAYIHEWGENKLKIDNIFKDKHYNINDKPDFWNIFKEYPNNDISMDMIDHKTDKNLKYASENLLSKWSKGNFFFF
jgi:hypothetical protein